MIRALSSLLAFAFALPTSGQTTEAGAFVSPCPDVFTYEPPGTEPGKWYGVVNLTTDTTLYALWLNVVLESKADILGNWVGEVTTEDNLDFKIENTKLKIVANQPMPVRFFIQYNPQSNPPKLQAIRFNGREICNVDNTKTAAEDSNRSGSNEDYNRPTSTITSTTIKPTLTTTKNTDRRQTTTKHQFWGQTKVENTYQEKTEQTTKSYWTQTKTDNQQTKSVGPQTTLKPQYWQQTKVENTQQAKSDRLQTTSKPQYWTQAKTEEVTQPTLRPHTWSYGKNDNAQSSNQKKVANTQQTTIQDANTRPADKVQKKIDVNNKNRQDNLYKQQTNVETTTQSQLWSQFKIGTKQQTKSDDKSQTKNDNKLVTTVKPLLWQQVTAVDNQDARIQTKTQSKPQEGKPTDQIQYWAETTVDGNSQRKTDVTGVDSSSVVLPDNNQQSRPDYQSRPYERLQTKPVDYTASPIYVRPEDKDAISISSGTQTKAQDGSRRQAQSEQLEDEGRLEIIPIKIQEELADDNQRSEEGIVNWSGDRRKTWFPEEQPKKRIIFESAGDSPSYHNVRSRDDESTQPFDGFLDEDTPSRKNPQRILQMDEFGIGSTKKQDIDIDGYLGGLPTIYIPNHPPLRAEPTCGRVLKKPSLRLQRGSTTEEGQWPWQIALYQQQTTVDFKYICGGTLVTSRHIITAAHCVTRKGSRRVVNKNTLTVYLGKYNLRTSVEGVQVKFVNKITVHPEYNASTFSRDVAILQLREPVTYSEYVQPACLWPENEIELKNIIGMKGSVVGWGFEVTGVAREELSLLEMPVVDQDTCVRSYIDFYRKFTSDYTYCAGYKDGTSVCNGDSGGGMVFKRGNNWFLRGLASLSVARQGEYRCDPDHYVIFTDLAKMLPWIEENIED